MSAARKLPDSATCKRKKLWISYATNATGHTKEMTPNNLREGDKNSTFSPILKAGSPL